MIDRNLKAILKQNMNHQAAVALLGPRQIGKTTLALEFVETRPSIYLDLESPADLFKLSDPLSFLSKHTDKLVVLDEIQRVPEIFTVLRGLIDKNRRSGRKFGQYLILGSASMDLLRQSSESLAGRINYLDMGGLNPLEVSKNSPTAIETLWLRGGFPESYLALSDEISVQWRENFIRTYLERDVPQMGFRIPAERLRRLWTMLAHLQGETINASSLGNSLEVNSKTVAHYLDILVDLLLVRRLEPWHSNTKKRLVKSPRFYIRDSGILHKLLDIHQENDLLSHPINGKSWEGFAVESLLSILPASSKAFFYRTAVGAEIDLLIKLSSQELWAIEVKRSTAPSLQRGFHQACKDLQVTRKWVVYGGDEEFPGPHDTTFTPLPKLMKELIEFNNKLSKN